jgi:hypothetical protein
MPMIGGVERPSVCSTDPAKVPWWDSTRPMAAINGHVMWQLAGRAAAAWWYAWSAVDGMPSAASAEAAPLALAVAFGSPPDSVSDPSGDVVRLGLSAGRAEDVATEEPAGDTAADGDGAAEADGAAEVDGAVEVDGAAETDRAGAAGSACGTTTRTPTATATAARRRNVCRCLDVLIGSVTVPLRCHDRLGDMSTR